MTNRFSFGYSDTYISLFSYSSSDFLNHVRMHFVSGQNPGQSLNTTPSDRAKIDQKVQPDLVRPVTLPMNSVHSEPHNSHHQQSQSKSVYSKAGVPLPQVHPQQQAVPSKEFYSKTRLNTETYYLPPKADSKKSTSPSYRYPPPPPPPTYEQSMHANQSFPPSPESNLSQKLPERSNSPVKSDHGEIDVFYEFFPNYTAPSPPSTQHSLNNILPSSPIPSIPFQPSFQPSFLTPYPFFSPKFSCMLCPTSFSTREELIYHINLHNTYPNQTGHRTQPQGLKRPKPQVHSPLCACVQCKPNKKLKKVVEDIDEETLKKISALEWERKHG